VWFKNSNDVFRYNVVTTGYLPINISNWGKEIDYNSFPDSVSLHEARSRGTDKNSVCGNQKFENSQKGDFRLKFGSAALTVGFKNFAMDSFGVVSPTLKAMSKKVCIPEILALDKVENDEVFDFMGARVKNLNTPGERSATGMDSERGVLILEIKPLSAASGSLQVNDVILLLNGKKINRIRDLLEARMSVIGSTTDVLVFRNQKEITIRIDLTQK